MIIIPTSEIKQPQFHGDSLGYTFMWNHHFLRGIFPNSVELAKSYFSSGLVDELTQKGLFPKTWVTDYQNEQFGLIVEHELISPVLYATEWNFEMLRDAALMVLQIAQIAYDHGFNMIDCHKRNVLFSNNRPLYVDLGSFIPNESGSTGWKPYMSFLHSYYYLLSLWGCGASLLAKRMMAPSIELDDENYWLFKSPFFRHFPRLMSLFVSTQNSLCAIAVAGNKRAKEKGTAVYFLKYIIDRLKPSKSQRLHAIEKKVRKMKRRKSISTLPSETKERIDGFVNLITTFFPSANSLAFINNLREGYYAPVLNSSAISKIISIQENEDNSEIEYIEARKQSLPVCCCHYRLKNNTVLVRGQFPEKRFLSDIAYVPQFEKIIDFFNTSNSVGFTELYLEYAHEAIILGVNETNEQFLNMLQLRHKVLSVPLNAQGHSHGGFMVVYK